MTRNSRLSSIFGLVLACGSACGSEGSTSNAPPHTTPVATMDPTPQTSAMSVRSAPAAVPDDDLEQWRTLVAESRTQYGGGSRMNATPAERRRQEAIDRAGERARNISPDRASQLVKAMLNAGMNAPDDDPCARVRAIYDLADGELELGDELHQDALRRCQNAPQTRVACLKPERERTPFERRVCRRFFTDTNAPDLFGEAMQSRPRIVREPTMSAD